MLCEVVYVLREPECENSIVSILLFLCLAEISTAPVNVLSNLLCGKWFYLKDYIENKRKERGRVLEGMFKLFFLPTMPSSIWYSSKVKWIWGQKRGILSLFRFFCPLLLIRGSLSVNLS